MSHVIIVYSKLHDNCRITEPAFNQQLPCTDQQLPDTAHTSNNWSNRAAS